MNYLFHLLIYFNIYAILALSLDLIVGYCGLFSLAHATFFTIGGYTYAILTTYFGFDFLSATLIAMFLGGILSLVVSLPAWRFRGDYFVLITLAAQSILFSLINNWSNTNFPTGTLKNMTNGPIGLTGITKPDIIGIKIDTVYSIFVLFTVVMLLSSFVFWLLKKSPWGRLLKSMRDDELAVRGLGKNVRLTKVYVLIIGCSFAALSGVLYSSYVSFLDPSSALLDQSILMLSMIIVGGTGNFRGPFVGAAVLLLIPEFLRLIQLPDSLSGNLQLLAYGLLLVLIVHLRPQGLAGEYKLK